MFKIISKKNYNNLKNNMKMINEAKLKFRAENLKLQQENLEMKRLIAHQNGLIKEYEDMLFRNKETISLDGKKIKQEIKTKTKTKTKKGSKTNGTRKSK